MRKNYWVSRCRSLYVIWNFWENSESFRTVDFVKLPDWDHTELYKKQFASFEMRLRRRIKETKASKLAQGMISRFYSYDIIFVTQISYFWSSSHSYLFGYLNTSRNLIYLQHSLQINSFFIVYYFWNYFKNNLLNFSFFVYNSIWKIWFCSRNTI